jgi:hypothetical protein
MPALPTPGADIEAAFAAMRWKHIRTVEAMQALSERNVELEREVYHNALAVKAEFLKKAKAFAALKKGVIEMFRLLKGELEISRTLIYTQSTRCYNDSAKMVNKLGKQAVSLAADKEDLTHTLGNRQDQLQRLQARLLLYEDEFAGDLKGS